MTRTGVSILIATVSVTGMCLVSLFGVISARECSSIDVRNNLASFNQIRNCTVIKGHLMIVLLVKNISATDYDNITFPELREITEFFLLFEVRGLVSFNKLLPNLTVIRGRRLFLNYALIVFNMPDLEALEFKSLVAIQRGHVFVGNCPKLCFLKKVNWDRLTLSPGENHVTPMAKDTCSGSACIGCEYCWSNMFCQKFENDNVVNLARGTLLCNSECLGGCYNSTNADCVVCRGITNHGVCVTECPSDLYYSEPHQRCYTKEECGAVRFYVHENECRSSCPSGYTKSRKRTECLKCTSGCSNVCSPFDGLSAFIIYNLADADYLRGCYHLNGSLYIEFKNKIDEKDLLKAFDSVHQIEGHVKIVRSPHLKSLEFLRNLEKINGNPLENRTFAFIVYDNKNLQELWTPQSGKTIEFVNGGIYAYSNNKLCNRMLNDFSSRIIHDKDMDLMHLNDQEVLCDPAKLNLGVLLITHKSAMISWPRNQTAEQVEVLYREAKYNSREESELDDNVCERVYWKRELLFKGELQYNSAHFLYNITDLKPYASYDVLLKTFQQPDGYSARSSIQRFLTKSDYPSAPKLDTLSKTQENITLALYPQNVIAEEVHFYWLDIFEHTVDLETLDTRNYCEWPIMFSRFGLEDYDDCCLRKEEEIEEDEFTQNMREAFPCTLDSKENCPSMDSAGVHLQIDGSSQNFTVEGLKPYTLYTFTIYACNNVGCGTYSMYNDKTEASDVADQIENVKACRVPDTNEYHVAFEEPKSPNGAIVTYTIHFQQKEGQDTPQLFELNCITRKEHEMSNYLYIAVFNTTFAQTAVRSNSLAGSGLSDWFDIEICQIIAPDRKIGAVGVLLICCLICGLAAIGWISVRRRWWRNVNFVDVWTRRRNQRAAGSVTVGDREGLVATFNAISLQNILDD